MKTLKWASLALLLFALVSIVPGQVNAKFYFADVPKHKEYYEEVHYIADRGIVNQVKNFNPGNSLTRVQAAKMLVIASQKESIPTPKIQFKDLKPGTEQYEFASRAVHLGYFKVQPDGRFKPNEKIKRAEMGYALSVAFNLSEKITADRPFMFADMKNHPYAEKINGLYYAGITRGDNGKFLPNENLTRSQFALFVARGLNDKFALQVKFPKHVAKAYFVQIETSGANLNVRQQPALTGAVQGKLKDGDVVEVLGESGEWLLILNNGQKGYIHKQYTKTVDKPAVTPEKPMKPEPKPVPKPEPKPVPRPVPKPEPKPDELAETKPTAPETETAAPPVITGNLAGKVTVNNLNVRQQPDPTSPIVTKLSRGKVVNVQSITGYWAAIEVDGKTGYVHKNYLKLVNQSGNPLKGRIIVLDPGHGGKDPGTTSQGVYEKTIVLKVAQRLESKLQNAGAKVMMTRTSDRYLTLQERTEFARKHYAETFVAIHVNSASPSAKGTEVFYDSSLNPNAVESKTLAQQIQKQIVQQAKMADRKVKDQRFYVIRNTTVPAVLVELGFITNSEDFKKLTSDEYIEIYANAIYDGLVQYYSTL